MNTQVTTTQLNPRLLLEPLNLPVPLCPNIHPHQTNFYPEGY